MKSKLDILSEINSRYDQMQEVKIRCMDIILSIMKDDKSKEERFEDIKLTLNRWCNVLDQIKDKIDENIERLQRMSDRLYEYV